jgi:hypothetical protein
MDEHDQYESVGLDDSLEDERNLDEIMADRRAAEAELDAREVRTGATADRKLPRMLHDQGNGSKTRDSSCWILEQICYFELMFLIKLPNEYLILNLCCIFGLLFCCICFFSDWFCA